FAASFLASFSSQNYGGVVDAREPCLPLLVLRVLAEGVETLSLQAGPGINGVTAIVSFSSHHAASMAKRVLMEDFKKFFSLDVSIKWQLVEKQAEHWYTQKAPKSVLPPDSTPIPGFCRAVGGPTATSSSLPGYPPSQGCLVFAASPGLLLCKMCEELGLGQPLVEIYYSHTRPDGFLHFTYMVHIPKMSKTFKGMVKILPGPNALKEAETAAAQQVLERIRNLAAGTPAHHLQF
uniref:Dead end n=1 Tax=Nothobranchius furzeri TaxID=105023 RepID=A0A8C6MD18_NOTFU